LDAAKQTSNGLFVKAHGLLNIKLASVLAREQSVINFLLSTAAIFNGPPSSRTAMIGS
jgi:hypothetical protein